MTSTEHSTVARVDPRTNLVVETIPVGKAPRFIAAGGGAVWTLNQGDGSVSRIDPKTNKVVATIEVGVPGGGGEIAVGEGSVWVTAFEFPLSRIDPSTNTVVQQFFGEGGDAVRVGLGSVWLSNLEAGNVWRIDPRRVEATLPRLNQGGRRGRALAASMPAGPESRSGRRALPALLREKRLVQNRRALPDRLCVPLLSENGPENLVEIPAVLQERLAKEPLPARRPLLSSAPLPRPFSTAARASSRCDAQRFEGKSITSSAPSWNTPVPQIRRPNRESPLRSAEPGFQLADLEDADGRVEALRA